MSSAEGFFPLLSLPSPLRRWPSDVDRESIYATPFAANSFAVATRRQTVLLYALRMDNLDSFKAAQRAGWAHFAPLQAITTEPAAHLVRHAGLKPGQRVLDVACGTGVVAVTAARRDARVTGSISLRNFSRPPGRMQIAAVEVDCHEGDAEHLPFHASALMLSSASSDTCSHLARRWRSTRCCAC